MVLCSTEPVSQLDSWHTSGTCNLLHCRNLRMEEKLPGLKVGVICMLMLDQAVRHK